MKNNRISRFLSLILVCTLMLQMFPLQVFAGTDDSSAAIDTPDAENPITIVGEEATRRNETEKHFRLSDGSYIAVTYGMPVHYQDEAGAWQDINNEPVMKTDLGGSDTYQVGNGCLASTFAASLDDGTILASSYEDVAVSMSLMDTVQIVETTDATIRTVSNQDYLTFDRTVTAKIVAADTSVLNPQNTEQWRTEDLVPDGLISTFLYEDVFPGVDLSYTAYGYNVKEEIIVKTPQSSYRYDFLLDMKGLTAVLNDDDSISLINDKGNVVYDIPAPFMEDGDGNISNNVIYLLTDTTEGTILTVEADAEWINEQNRAFPIKIDPTLKLTAKASALLESADMYGCFVQSGDPTSAGPTQYLYSGYSTNSADKNMRIYLHVNKLPSLPKGSVVTNATLSMRQYSYHNQGHSTMPIGLYEVTGSKPSSIDTYYEWIFQICWNNKPAINTSNIIDYATVSSSTTSTYVSWDATELVKKWYTEGTENRTLALGITQSGTYSTSSGAWQVFYGYSQTYPPMFVVSYRNNTGIEPYYTYNSLDAKSAGAAYIADASGQLKVVNELVSYASTTNPFSLNLIYNSDYFAYSNSTNYLPPSKLGLNMSLGAGWTLDCIQKVKSKTISSVEYLEYCDGDGTLHYFAKNTSLDSSGTYYFDEDGLGLKIKNTGTNDYQMLDDHGNTWTFTDYYLRSIVDSDGNTISITYSDSKITSIKQKNKDGTTITIATFEYSGNDLTKITDAAGNVYTLTYDSSNLVAIQKGSTTIAQYGYTGYRLNSMTDAESNYSLAFTYKNGKVSSYKELVAAVSGAQVSISYPNYSQTIYRDYGADRTQNTDDDVLNHYLFDNSGRTANAYSTDALNNVLGANNCVYTTNTNTKKNNNRILRSTSIGIAGQQLINNTSLEAASGWTLNDTSLSTTKPRTGEYSITGTLSSAGIQYAETVSEALSANSTYTLSAYINTSEITDLGQGIYLRVADSAGNEWTSEPLNYSTTNTVDDGWTRISVTFTAQRSEAHAVAICNDGCVGTFYADDFQLEKGDAPSGYNLVENGNMQSSVTSWTLSTGASISTSVGASSSTNSLQIDGDPTSSGTYAYQDIKLNLPGTQTYLLSGWVKANAVTDNITKASDSAQDKYKQCGMRVRLTYSDDTTEYHYVPFNTDLSTWQFVSYIIVPKEPNKTVAEIRIFCAYERNANTAYFDNISLLREAAQTMKYDSNGNLVSVTTTGLNTDVNTYENGNLIRTVTGGNGTYEYTYDATYTHRLTSVTNDLITQSMSYDGMGNLTSTILSGTGNKTISTSAGYDSTGNRLTSVVDATGAEVTYSYGTASCQMLGLPTAIENPNGTVTTTEYDLYNRVSETAVASWASLVYNYSNGNLGAITRTNNANAGQTYSFAYDDFGNTLSISVGERTLAAYEYAPGNGQLARQTYGNGDVVSFTYDNLGRTKTITHDDGSVLTYTYNGEGQLYSATEINGEETTTYLYTYDSLGRLVYSEKKDSTTSHLRTHQEYNSNNQLTENSWQVGEAAYSESYTYSADDGSLSSITITEGENSSTVSMTYDELCRLSQKTIARNGVTLVTYTYTYRDMSDTATTTQVASLTVASPNSNVTYCYSYDISGNITQISDGTTTTTYDYDALGQLRSVSDGTNTYSYTYDAVGNLLAANGHSYSYEDTLGWGDLLTAYDGQTITHDAIGNPLNDGTWTYTWENGRELASMTDGTTTWTYTYDADGMRASRSNGSTTYEYVYNGDSLLKMTVDNNTLYFTSDTVTYNGVTYYYVTNLQGDVIAILDSSGASVVEYTYDAWGNILTTTGSMAATLGAHNPLRYRGYVYDTETQLYYCQSRYYDPATGRFLNADAYASTGQGILGNNMFAYCNNNPVNYSDNSGTSSTAVLEEGLKYVMALLAALDSATPFVEVATLVVLGAIAINELRERQQEESIVISDSAVSTGDQSAIYYGADIVGDSTGTKAWRIQTGPMDYETAIAWTYITAASGPYGKNANWGLYTKNQNDAAKIAIFLGGVGPTLHDNRINEYPHYHVNGMLLFGQYKHFHVWYGEIYMG